MSAKIPVWSWRHAVAKTNVPTLTKALCWAIGNYLSDAGKGCWPSMGALVADTGMCERSITTHLKTAAAAGLLQVRRIRNDKGHLGPYTYHPCFPKTVEFQTDIPPSEGGILEGSDPGAPDAPRESLGALGSEPRRTTCATREVSKEKISKVSSKSALTRGLHTSVNSEGSSRSSRPTVLDEDWELPADWRDETIARHPAHADMIDVEASRFLKFNIDRLTASDDWPAMWARWFDLAVNRAPGTRKARAIRDFDSGASVRETDEPWPVYAARMKREGKWKPTETAR